MQSIVRTKCEGWRRVTALEQGSPNRVAVDAVAKQESDRDVADHAALARLLEQRAEDFRSLLTVGSTPGTESAEAGAEPLLFPHIRRRRGLDIVSGPDLSNVADDGSRGDDVAQCQELDCRPDVEIARHVGCLDERCNARGKHQALRRPVPEKWPLTESIPHQPETLGLRVEERERPVTDQAWQRLRPPAQPGMKHHLGVAATPEPRRIEPEFGRQFAVVVDLAVERQEQTPARVRHRLMPGRTAVDDRQPAMSERRSTRSGEARIVRPATRQASEHPLDRTGVVRGAGESQNPRDAAHS